MKVTAIIFDAHRPFHDHNAYSLMMSILQSLPISQIILGGDFADCYNINLHGKNLNIEETLEEEVEDVISSLAEFNIIFPKAKKIFIVGNHEARLERYITNNCPELFGVTTIEKLFFLQQYKFTMIPYTPSQSYYVENIAVRHEPIGNGINCAQATISKSGESIIFGHTHRIQRTFSTTLGGKQIQAISGGWLGNKNHPAFSYVKNHHNWQMGFVLVYEDRGEFFIEQVFINDNYRALANGVLWQ